MNPVDTRPLILVVDDEEMVRAVARRHLESWGYRVIEAGTGAQGIDLAITYQPHMILLDVRMPGMSGFEVLPRLRSDPVLAFIPVVMLTGLSSSVDHTNGIRLGADDYLTKPLDIVLFQARVNSLVKRESYRREVEELRRNFTAMIVHDLRNPLNVIRAFAELLQEEEANPDPEFVRTSLERIIASSDRALELVSQMLDLSQLQSGRVKLFRRRENLSTMLHAIAEDQQILAQRKKIEFRTLVSGNIEADVDQRKLAEAIINLLQNAIKFTPEGGQITLEANVLGNGQVEVLVTDTGPGIPKEQIGALFAPWQQAKTAGRSSVKGYGLGLAIARMVVEAHGGEIGCESELGNGTTFRMKLPVTHTGTLAA